MTNKYPQKEKFLPTKTREKHDWSEYQKTIFREISKGQGNVIILARAGSAKTSTLVEGSRYIPKGKVSLFCAFNKSIQEELRAKLPSYTECRTLHSLALAALKNRFGSNIEINNNKCWEIVSDIVGNIKDNYDLIGNICQTITMCKANLVDTPPKIEDIINEYGIDLCEIESSQFISYVCRGLRECKEKTSVIDYNDMIWFCFVYRIKPPGFDVVMVDEAQDLTKAMIELALSAAKPVTGRVIVVMDNFQAIYGFAGADSSVLDNLRARLNAKELSLPICYRCPIKVVNEAKKFVEDIQVYDKAIEGKIEHIEFKDLLKKATIGSYIISRFNAPLIRWCLFFLKNNIPSNMLGRDFGESMGFLIKKSKKKTIIDFIKWLAKWEKEEKERLLAKYPKASVDAIVDKAECLRNLCEGAKSIDDLKKNIESLFQDNDEKKIVLFSSIHKIKGKQARNVFVLADTLRDYDQQERNLEYISLTRTQENLYMVWKVLPEEFTEDLLNH